MASPKPLRLQLGLSQAEFADLLGTNAGQLSMAESGLRSLPAASQEIASAIETALRANNLAEAGTQQWTNKAVAQLKKEIRSGEVKLNLLQQQEQKLTEKLGAARCMLLLANNFTAPVANTHSEDVNLQLALLQRKASKKIAVLELKQIQLQLAIASTAAALAKAKDLAFY